MINRKYYIEKQALAIDNLPIKVQFTGRNRRVNCTLIGRQVF